MTRVPAAILATAIALTVFAAVFAGVSWFMQAIVPVIRIPHALAETIAIGIPSLTSTFMVFWVVLSQRQNSAKQTDPSSKPAPRLWERALQRRDE